MVRLKALLLIACSLVVATSASAQNTITVKIGRFKNLKGTFKLRLTDAKETIIQTKIQKVTSNSITVTLNNVPDGKYVIDIFHDQNDNNKMDTNFLGIPKEGWGCSNNARGVMAAPKIKDKIFNVTQNTTVDIKLLYY
jgi:uncharacterized protein (DUF2141 family)